ncbi:hypothetical protein H7200_01245 [Candidatus Saccharibacteria bacterium]|nr:hypothetical protein [Candidatus Saccharibacteria bacterium]
MPIKNQIDAILQEKMDRKDFLKYAGTIVLGAIGVTGLVRMILTSRGITSTAEPEVQKSRGYGSSTFGK